MIVEIPFAYTAAVVPPGKRNPRETHVIDRVAIRVPTAAEGELPVAFRFSPGRDVPWGLEGGELRAFHEARAMEIRWDGSGLWAPHGHSFDRDADRVAANAERLAEAEAVALIEGMSHTPFASAQWNGLVDWQRRAAVRADRLEGRVVADNRRDRVADILALARKVRFHDGRFWEPAEEPCWTGEGDRFPRATAELSSPWRLRSPSTVWRADRVADALEDLDRERGNGDHPPEAEGLIEILVPEAVRLRVDETQLVSAARGVVGSMKDTLPGASVEFFAAYAELRDAAAASPDDAVSERLAGAVAAMLARPETLEAEDGRRNWLFRHLEAAERRWVRSLSAPAPAASGPGEGANRAFGR